MQPRFAALSSAAFIALVAFSACSTTANVADVYTGLDAPDAKGQTRRRSVFYTDTKEIHCIAQAGIGRTDATLEATIRQNQAYDFKTNQFFETERYLGYNEFKPQASKDPIYVDFTLGHVDAQGQPKDDEPFLPGRYVCEVRLDGELAGSAAFNIDFPPCPPAFIIPGAPCFRFYAEGTECPKYGEFSPDPAKCRCRAQGGWECDPT